MFLALIWCQFGGVVRVGMSTTAELSSLLLPLLNLLHMPTAALIMLWKKPEVIWETGNSCMVADGDARWHGINLPSSEFSFAAPPWPPVEQHLERPDAPLGLFKRDTEK